LNYYKIKKIATISGVIVAALSISNIHTLRVKKAEYDAVRVCAIADRLTAQEGFNANEIILALYKLGLA
jgi:hypothetical protein